MKLKDLVKLMEEEIPGGVIYSKDVENGVLHHDYSKDTIKGDFDCRKCKLTSLKNCPTIIKGDFLCSDNEYLHTLKGGPKEVYGNFNCENNPILTSLEYCPEKITGQLIFFKCPKITSLEGIGTKYCFRVDQQIYINKGIKSNILGLLKIKNLLNVETFNSDDDLKLALKIINRHLKSGRNLRKCKLELEEAGLQEYAML